MTHDGSFAMSGVHPDNDPDYPMSLLRDAVGAVDKASARCPIRSSGRYIEKCPTCRAGLGDSCGLELAAIFELERAVRTYLKEIDQ